MVGRNDPCPCGSGKKYKKCCNVSNVVSFGDIVDRELEQLQNEMIQYADREYPVEIEAFVDNNFGDMEEYPEEISDVVFFQCLLYFITSFQTKDGETVIEEYIEQILPKVKRTQTREIVKSWTEAKPSLVIAERVVNQNQIEVRDFFTDEPLNVRVPVEITDVESGSLMLTILLPNGEGKWKMFAIGLDTSSEQTEELTPRIYQFYEDSDLAPDTFVFANFVDLIDMFVFGQLKITADNLEWDNQGQLEVAKGLETRVKSYFEDPVFTSTAIALWNKFCLDKNTRIQKPELYIAAMIYLLGKHVSLGGAYTQKEIADDFQLKSSSISSKYNELKDGLKQDLALLDQSLIDFNDDDDEIFYDDDEDYDFSSKPRSLKEEAQELIFQAFESKGKRRKELAEQALSLYPNSPDAYIILSETAKDPISVLAKGLEIGERELGKKFFQENKGDFWLINETRPYMRVKFQLALMLQNEGRHKEAIRHYEEMLQLNEGDNQGARFSLFSAYVENNQIKEAEYLLKKFDEDESCKYLYNSLFIELIQNGDTKKAKQMYEKAVNHNSYVGNYLVGKKKLPKSLPLAYWLGDENEAIVYAAEYIHLWKKHPGLIDWLQAVR